MGKWKGDNDKSTSRSPVGEKKEMECMQHESSREDSFGARKGPARFSEWNGEGKWGGEMTKCKG